MGRARSRRSPLLAQGLRGQPHRPGGDGRLQPAAVDLPARADRAVRRRPRAALARSSQASVLARPAADLPDRGREHADRRRPRALQQSSTTVGIVALVAARCGSAPRSGARWTRRSAASTTCRAAPGCARSCSRSGCSCVVLLFIARQRRGADAAGAARPRQPTTCRSASADVRGLVYGDLARRRPRAAVRRAVRHLLARARRARSRGAACGRARSARRSRWRSSTTPSRSTCTNVSTLRVGTTLVFVLIALVWFYVLALILLAGAVVNELRFERRRRRALKAPRRRPPIARVTPIQGRPRSMRDPVRSSLPSRPPSLGVPAHARPRGSPRTARQTPAEPRRLRRRRQGRAETAAQRRLARPHDRRPRGRDRRHLRPHWVLKQVKARKRGQRRRAPAWRTLATLPLGTEPLAAPGARRRRGRPGRRRRARRHADPHLHARPRPARSACSTTATTATTRADARGAASRRPARRRAARRDPRAGR